MIDSNKFISLFKIAGCFVRDIKLSEKEIVIEVYKRRKTGVCPICLKRTKLVHQRRQRKVLHELIGTQRVFLLLTRRRFICKGCQKTFAEEVPFLLGKKRITANLIENILNHLKPLHLGESQKQLEFLTMGPETVFLSFLR